MSKAVTVAWLAAMLAGPGWSATLADGGTRDGAAVPSDVSSTGLPGGSAVSVTVEPARVKLGEPFDLVIRVRTRQAADVELPSGLDLGPFTELGRSRTREMIEGHPVEVLRLELVTYEKLGELSVPGFRLVCRDEPAEPEESELVVPDSRVEVVSLLAGIEQPEPRDVAGPVAVTVPDHRLLVFAGLLVCWVGCALMLRRRRAGLRPGQRFEDLPPERPAHEIALAKLRAVVDDDLVRQGRVHEYFVRISEGVREYLGNRYGFFALDLTTRELLEELRDRPTPGLDLGLVERMLRDADLVKFARMRPGDEMISRAIDGAYALVESTRIVPLSRTGTGAEMET